MNILKLSSHGKVAFKVIDFEFSGVGPAVLDFGGPLGLLNTFELKKKLMEGYYCGSGLSPPTDSDVQLIIIDVALDAMFFVDDYWYFDLVKVSGEEAPRRLQVIERFAEYVRGDDEVKKSLYNPATNPSRVEGGYTFSIRYDVWEPWCKANGVVLDPEQLAC